MPNKEKVNHMNFVRHYFGKIKAENDDKGKNEEEMKTILDKSLEFGFHTRESYADMLETV